MERSIFSKITATRFVVSALVMSLGATAFADSGVSSENFWSNVFSTPASSSEREQPKRKTTRKKRTTAKAVRTAPKAVKPANTEARVAPVAKTKPAPAVATRSQQEATQEEQQETKTQKVVVAPEVLDAKMANLNHIDGDGKIAKEPLRNALAFYAQNRHKFSNHRYLGVIDFTKKSSEERFCIINIKTGDTDCMKTSHGIGSDGGAGRATRFSNRPNSHASSVGYYKTMATYSGKHGISLRMDGLSATNSKALERAIVIHGAWYVKEGTRSISGRSHGCPALDNSIAQNIIQKMKGGALIYAWHKDHN